MIFIGLQRELFCFVELQWISAVFFNQFLFILERVGNKIFRVHEQRKLNVWYEFWIFYKTYIYIALCSMLSRDSPSICDIRHVVSDKGRFFQN